MHFLFIRIEKLCLACINFFSVPEVEVSVLYRLCYVRMCECKGCNVTWIRTTKEGEEGKGLWKECENVSILRIYFSFIMFGFPCIIL